MQQQNLRRLPLQGANNVRDLGGYACEGGATRWRGFLRADGTGSLTDADLAALKAYGITTAIDLRSAHEVDRDPSRLYLSPEFQAYNVPMLDNIMSGPVTGMPASLGDLYITLLDKGGADFAAVFRLIAAAKGGVLFHCAVGKDRTGVTAMLLLKLAGVSDADVVADYAASEVYLHDFFQSKLAEYEAYNVPTGLLRSEAANMQQALAHLRKTYESAEGYLQTIGLTSDEIAAVREKLVERA